MRVRDIVLALGFLPLLAISACCNGGKSPAIMSLVIDSGNCAGCLLGTDDGLSSFVVRTETEYESMMATCAPIRPESLPPRPGRGEVLVFVSREGSGCEGCLDIVNVRESSREIIVGVEGGFQGACEMLITLGAWAHIPKTNKPIRFAYRDAPCSGDR